MWEKNGMSSSTNMISGLASGIDWKSIVSQLMEMEHQRVDIIEDKKTETAKKLSEWQSFNTRLLALKTAAGNLKDPEAFAVFKASMSTDSSTIDASDLLTVSTTTTASVGSYTLKINNLATAEKRSSCSFSTTSEALGSDYSGDIIINGAVIAIASTDTLTNVKDKINNANSGSNPTGVTAGVVTYGTGDCRLILTSDKTGADGISLLNGGATDILNALGLSDTSRTAKNSITGGDRTDRFSSTSISIQSLLGLTSAQTSGAGDIVINGQAVGAIDLATDTLSSLQTKFTAAGLTATITTETENDQTYYRLMVQGSGNTYTDKNHILETLGFIEGGISDEYGVIGDVANTCGGTVITDDTLIKDIDGFTGYQVTDYIHLEGTDTDGVAVSDDTLVLSDATTVGDLLDKIRSVFGDVSASITGDGKLRIVDTTPGASPLAVKIDVRNSGGSSDDTLKFDANGDLGSAASIRKRQLVAGADASLTVDGVDVTRSENTITDIMTGVTLDLLKADTGTTVTLNVGRDTEAVTTKIRAFVTSYNTVSSYIHTQSSYDATEQKVGGVLFGDGTLSSVKSDLTSLLVQSVWGVASEFSTMGLIGVNVDTQGQLSVNGEKLAGYLTTNFNDVQQLFTAHAVTSNGTLTYIGHTSDTKQGNYTIHIDTAATKSTSAASDNTSLSGDETLTITEVENSAEISLTSGMTMSQIANAVNSELATVYTQILTGAEQLYADSGQAAKITASTKWNSVYDSAGNSAGLVDGDTISFTGITRSGGTVSGSYSISDVTEDTVQGLLSAIEEAFDNNVTAAINASGQIVVTDKTSGNSSIALTLDCTQAHDLDFGSITTGNAGGQVGRYALNINASLDAGNHLVVAHNDYGTGHDFTIHQSNNLLWTGGDQTVNNGVDVSGTINGEAATGTGQVLKGDADDANVDGLSIRYTGTSGGIDAGTTTLTFGVAELYDRTLFSITDSFEGYLSYKQESLQNSITAYETQIDDMEDLLALKRERMTSQYERMELALQKLQNQSSWLTNQLSAAAGGWMSL